MPSHRRRNSLPTSYKVPITQPSFKPTAFFYDEKSATQYLKKIVRDVKSGGGIITLAQLGRLRIQFEEITHFLISNGFSTHPDEFTVYFWNCLSPQLISAMSDALIWDGHMILADIYSIETLPPYNILIQYIHRCYSSPDNPKETPSRIYITSQENQQSNQHYLDQSSMEERETEDQSPVIDIVDSSALNTPISESPTLVDIPGKVEFEGNISQNFSEEQESVLESVEETQSFNMNSVENLPEESIITEDHSFRIDNHYFPECLSQSEWEFQSILSKTSSLNLLETINPLDFIPEESFLTISEHQDYISPSPIPSSPAPTNTLKISTSQKIEEENNAQKDPGKPIESSILPIKLKSSQQESSCDPIHLPEIGIIEKDLHFVKPPGRCLNGLKPLWNFLSGCLVLLLGLSGTVCSLVVDRAGLQDISVGSGLGGNQKGGLANFFDSPVWGEPLGFAQLSDLKLSPAIGNGRYNHHQHAFGGLQLKPVACPIFRPLSRCKQPKEPQTYNFSARISLSTPAVKSGQSEQSSLWTSRWKRDRKRVIDDDYERQQRTPIKFINPTAAASSVPVRTPESDDINDDTCREILALQLIAFLDRSTDCYYYWMHPSTMSLAHESRYSDPQWTSRKLLYARSCKQTALENINNSTRKDTMELLDFHRIVCLDHLFDFCCYQPHHHNTFSTFSPDHDSEHLIAFSE
ncbi:hypothetical protein Pst134EA_025722 [Puccinia striiformis f. sp. tritici]|uniref:hypothetical protein n=1 Tax=Puccinia striiformis f. sp. tritici TaxID=168172 RepID=UPI00200827E1|nr:hypothetical protein Pst134EA_025722 [Puccinia striiformis f. sp. tritici]KAH9451784.1 hypothetical protein Pst134EA_025722 [Puccinia striiformis f. sp. tritici]